MSLRHAIAVAAALGTTLVAGRARAWTEAHETGAEARVVVDGHGVAAEEHRLRWHVVRGPLASVDLGQVDRLAVLEPDVTVSLEDGRTLAAHALRRDDGTVRVTLEQPKALMRGNVSFAVRWSLDLVASGHVARDGATLRLAWSAPAVSDGLDGARVVFDLPAAPEEPRPIAAASGLVDDGVAAVLHRGSDRDVLELTRPHVPRGEAAAWLLRVDPRALGLVADPRFAPPPAPPPPPEPDRLHALGAALALAGLALAFGGLVRRKAGAFAATCAARGARVRGLVPLPEAIRPWLAGFAFAAAAGLEARGQPTVAACSVALAVMLASLRAPMAPPPVRGPGRWQAMRPREAFARASADADALDGSTPHGRAVALAVAGMVGVAAFFARRFDGEGAWLVTLDAAALVPLWFTGCASQLPPHPVGSAAPWLASLHARVRALRDAEVSPYARVRLHGSGADELRLRVAPRMPMPGLMSIEVGLAWTPTPSSWASSPEVLVRVLEGSPAAARVAADLPRARALLGRTAEERVFRLLPRAPTASGTAGLVAALSEALKDRRIAPDDPAPPVHAPPRRTPERRRPRPAATAPQTAPA